MQTTITNGHEPQPPGVHADRQRYLTTHSKREHPEWVKKTVMLPGWQEEVLRHWPEQVSYFRSLQWAWRLFRASRDFDGVITGSEHVGHLFALLQRVFRSSSARVPHVFVDFPFAAVRVSVLKRLQMRFEAPAITRIVALGGPDEIGRFAETFGISRGKFTFIPYHHTLYGMNYEASDGDYIFAGGDPTRDYATLVRAASGMPWRVVICARYRHHFAGLDIPPNVEIITATAEEFSRLMAGSRIVVLPIASGAIHTGGHTIIANAMSMGKPVIVAGAHADYCHFVDNGKTGLLIPPADLDSLRRGISSLMRDERLRRQLGSNAKMAARQYTPEAFFERVFALIEEEIHGRHGCVVPQASYECNGTKR